MQAIGPDMALMSDGFFEKNTMKHVLSFPILCGIALLIVWVFGASKAGLFLRDVQVFAWRVDEHSIEPFSRDKKFVDIGGWRVAYIDRGSGEPIVLLHGCPFQSFEYLVRPDGYIAFRSAGRTFEQLDRYLADWYVAAR